ncbi:MAG: hypothetical protein V3U85_09000 [Hyphomicrobium sp.]
MADETHDVTPMLLKQLRDDISGMRAEMHKGFSSIEVRMRLMQGGLEALGADVRQTEQAVAELAGLMGNVAETVESNSQRIRALEESLRDS